MIEVVAALIWDKDKFLICQRPVNKARALLWEFVGGKVVTYPLKDNYGDGFFNHYRIKFIKDVLGGLSQELPRVDVNGSAFVCVKETNDGTKYYFYANLSPDETQKLTIEGKVVKEKLALYQSVVYKLKNGKLKKIAKSRKV